MRFRGDRVAFGGPGIEPRWTHSNKDGIGTAYSADTRLWYTLWNGIVTEVYYPRADLPQLRDLQFLITGPQGLFHEEKRDLEHRTERITPHALGYRIINKDPGGRYSLHKTVTGDCHLPCLLQHVRWECAPDAPSPLRLYVLCAPHLLVGGWGNNGAVLEVMDRKILVAHKGDIWLALGADRPFRKASVGYVGTSDGWTDISRHGEMTWNYDLAPQGNIALTGELGVEPNEEFVLGLAFGRNMSAAVTTLFQSLGVPYHIHRERFVEQWGRVDRRELPAGSRVGDHGHLYHGSVSILLAHEDKIFPGAFIASLSIPWGSAMGDEDQGGYHLVWTRDMVNTATALLAAGNREAPLRALIYLATNQQPDGGFPQNFWLDGTPYWRGIQLDEVAFPILLAWALHEQKALQEFDPYPLVLGASRYLIEHGPATQQERWEEVSGYSPSTLAANIAALVLAGQFARLRHDHETAQLVEDYADFLECHVERWTVTNRGSLVPGHPRHYIRILPVSVDDPTPLEDPDRAMLPLKNVPPGHPSVFPARDIVDGGFLELVRRGIRSPRDPLIEASVEVMDRVLRVETPQGPAWHRYNHDGYGQRDDGGPYLGYGRGRAWPLLTGERGHYELARGNDPRPYLRALEAFGGKTGLLPEQVWDEEDRPELHLFRGRPIESAVPLAWAHAEYVKLVRSAEDGRLFDLPAPVANRYLGSRKECTPREIWKFNRQPQTIPRGCPLRVLARAPFVLRFTTNGWASWEDRASHPTPLGIEYVDLEPLESPTDAVEFTFRWPEAGRWEGRNFRVRAEG